MKENIQKEQKKHKLCWCLFNKIGCFEGWKFHNECSGKKHNKEINRLNTKQGEDGFYHFYWGKHDIDCLWMNFFSNLDYTQEAKCAELFMKKHGKRLNKKYYKINN